uniref:Uncharacterized protein n=1 Tax=Lepeophtheirus salmonis TaxID=72036 RepID=A0A0K2TIM6_LEPSM
MNESGEKKYTDYKEVWRDGDYTVVMMADPALTPQIVPLRGRLIKLRYKGVILQCQNYFFLGHTKIGFNNSKIKIQDYANTIKQTITNNVSREENEGKKTKKIETVSQDTVSIDQIVMDILQASLPVDQIRIDGNNEVVVSKEYLKKITLVQENIGSFKTKKLERKLVMLMILKNQSNLVLVKICVIPPMMEKLSQIKLRMVLEKMSQVKLRIAVSIVEEMKVTQAIMKKDVLSLINLYWMRK